MSDCSVSNFTLVAGVGNYEENTACIMSAAVAYHRIKNGEPLGKATDDLKCCCPVIRAYLIRLNDSSIWDSDAERTQYLLPLIPLIIDTRSKKSEQKRAYLLADWAIRKIAPIALRISGNEENAKLLESLLEIVDIPTARTAATAAAAAVDAAYAHDAYAAAAAVDAAAYAHDAYAAYVAAATYAAVAAYADSTSKSISASSQIRNLCIDIVYQLIACK